MSVELQRVLDQIEQIEQAHRQGHLSDELYASAKQRLNDALMASISTASVPTTAAAAPGVQRRWATRQIARAHV